MRLTYGSRTGMFCSFGGNEKQKAMTLIVNPLNSKTLTFSIKAISLELLYMQTHQPCLLLYEFIPVYAYKIVCVCVCLCCDVSLKKAC